MTAGPDLPESRGEEKTEYRLDGIQIQTTSRCQGRCIICPYSTSWHAKNPGDMDDRTFEIIIDQIKDIPTGKICPYLENEPLMDPKLFERIRIIRDTCTYGLIEVATNALLLDDERGRKLIDLLAEYPHEIWISFHGADKESYETVMRLPFEKTVSNVLSFLKLCDEMAPQMQVIVRGTGLPKLSRWESVRSAKFFGETAYRKFWEDALRAHNIQLRPRIDFFRYHDRAANVKDPRLNFRKKPRRDLASINCCRVHGWLHFLYNGDLILCCMDYHRETVFGNIREESLDQILKGPCFTELSAQARGQAPSPDDFICRRCFSPGG